jgi:tight adherence protein C
MNLAHYLPFGMSVADLITLMSGVAAFLMVFAVWNATIVRDPMRGRVKSLQLRREALKTGYTTARKRPHHMRHVKSVGFMRQVVKNFNLSRQEKTAKINEQLARAGWRTKDALVIFLFFKLVLPVIIGILAIIMIYGLEVLPVSPLVKMGVALGAIGLSAMAPNIFISNKISKRRAAFLKALPDALDLLVICAEAGLTLDAALNRVGRENARSFPELADEFSLTAIELGFLPNRRQALTNLNSRVELPSVRAVTATLIQAEKYGTPLANSLRVLSGEFRNERMMKAEEKAAKLPVIMTVPLILFIMPTLFIVLLGPASCRVADQFVHRG